MNRLETSYLVDYEKGTALAKTYFDAHADEPLTASTISVFELAFGVVWDGQRDLTELRKSLTWVEFSEFSIEDALEGARIQAELQGDDNRVPITDIMIAGVVRHRGATLVAADSQFDYIEGLSVDFHRSRSGRE